MFSSSSSSFLPLPFFFSALPDLGLAAAVVFSPDLGLAAAAVALMALVLAFAIACVSQAWI